MNAVSRTLTTLALALITATDTQGALPSAVELQMLGMTSITTGTSIDGVEIRDLSGIAYNRRTDRFLAVNDSPGAGNARIFSFILDYDSTGVHAVTPLGSDPLLRPNGLTLPNVDAEGLALSQRGAIYVSTEGRQVNGPQNSRDPWVWEFDADSLLRTDMLPVPAKFLPADASGESVPPGSENHARGVGLNLGFEGLSLSPAEHSLFVATEAALMQDDSRTPFDGTANQAQNSLSRILRFTRNDQGDWQPGAEKAYRADQGTSFLFVRRFNTVPSVLAIDDTGRLLVMERGLTQNNLDTGSYRIRIYEVDFDQPDATDISAYESLLNLPTPVSLRTLQKRLVWENSSGMDNVEGMTWGRDLNGMRTLVLVSDNNSSTSQETQFIVLQSNIPAPVSLNLSTSGPGTVSVDPDIADHMPGSVITLRAVAMPGTVFSRWEGDVIGTSETLHVTVPPVDELEVTARFLTPFEAWLRQFHAEEEFSSGEREDPAFSSAGDGVPNLLKYALGIHADQPVNDPSALARIVLAQGSQRHPALTFERPEPPPSGVRLLLETSSNLENWQPHHHLTPIRTDEASSPGWSVLKLISPHSIDSHRIQFLRLGATQDD